MRLTLVMASALSAAVGMPLSAAAGAPLSAAVAAPLSTLPGAPSPVAAPADSVVLSSAGPLKLGEWRSVPVGLVLEQFKAQPGETYRVEIRWPKSQGTYTLELESGTLPTDGDLEDAAHVVKAPTVGPARGTAHQHITVPANGNAVWFRIRPMGKVEQMIEFRLIRVRSAAPQR